jgi:hypothetical protein
MSPVLFSHLGTDLCLLLRTLPYCFTAWASAPLAALVARNNQLTGALPSTWFNLGLCAPNCPSNNMTDLDLANNLLDTLPTGGAGPWMRPRTICRRVNHATGFE